MTESAMALFKIKINSFFWCFIGVYSGSKPNEMYLFEKKKDANSARHRMRIKIKIRILCLVEKTGKSGSLSSFFPTWSKISVYHGHFWGDKWSVLWLKRSLLMPIWCDHFYQFDLNLWTTIKLKLNTIFKIPSPFRTF